MLVVLSAAASCTDNNPGISSDSGNNQDFKYIENDDEPLSYNAMEGGMQIKYFDGCIYFLNGSSAYGWQENHATLYRFNTKTGNLTTVCADPLCKHNSPECPFYSMENRFYVYENKIYYDRTYVFDYKETGFYADFVSFDISNSKLKQYIVYTDSIPDGIIGSQLYVDNYIFYYDIVVDSKTNTSKITINRMNLKDGSVVVMNADDSTNDNTIGFNNMFLFAVDQRIYFSDGKKIYSTDYNMNNRQDIMSVASLDSNIKTDGEYIYWGESERSDNAKLQTLYRAKLDGSGKTPLNIKAEKWQITKNYIYYLNPQETVIGKNEMEQRNGGDIVLEYNEIRRAAHDGLSNELVFSLIQDDIYFEIYPYYFSCVGNYIYTAYHTYTDKNNNGAYDDSEYYQSSDSKTYTILRIDVITGDTYYIHCGTEDN